MSRLAVAEDEIRDAFGPHLSRSTGPRLDAGRPPRPGRQDPLLLLRAAVRDRASR